MEQNLTLSILVKLYKFKRRPRSARKPARPGRWGYVRIAALHGPAAREERSYAARRDGSGGERAVRAARRLLTGSTRPLSEAHPELRVAIVKMEGALRDLYEAADAVLIEQLETHPHFGCTALHWLGEETEADPEFGISLDVERLRARKKRHDK